MVVSYVCKELFCSRCQVSLSFLAVLMRWVLPGPGSEVEEIVPDDAPEWSWAVKSVECSPEV